MVLVQLEVPDKLHELIGKFKVKHNLRNNRETIIIILETYLKSYYNHNNDEEVSNG